MKPKPFSALNHLTVPCDMSLLMGLDSGPHDAAPGSVLDATSPSPWSCARNIVPCERAHDTNTQTTTTTLCSRPGAQFIPAPAGHGPGGPGRLCVNIVDLH